ncbi:MAG: hypothetical protein NTZ05_05740 [Chloroflexi bacterium]|nr:hypothetical protein [Chloroflexota bacterium]
MIIAAHAVRTETTGFQIRLVFTRNQQEADPPLNELALAVSAAVRRLGFPTAPDSHTVLAYNIPREWVRRVSLEMVRAGIRTVAQWREAEIPLPDDVRMPYSVSF